MIVLHLPFPPTANTGTRHAGGRHYLTEQVQQYRAEVSAVVLQERGLARPISERLSVVTLWSPPDNRRRDGHNLTKTLHDALTKAGLWHDDEVLIPSFSGHSF